MSQLHKRFTDEQIRVLLQGYCEGKMPRAEIQNMLGVGKARFFALLKRYRQDPTSFSLNFQRSTPARLSNEAEAEIESALLREKEIVENLDLLISEYNYTAMKDRLEER